VTPLDWDPVAVGRLVAVAGLVVHVCWVRPWNARRRLRASIDILEADAHADVAEGYLSSRSAGYVELRSRLVRLRERPSRAVHLLSVAWGGGGEPAGPSFTVGECPPDDRPRLEAYVRVLDDAAREYASVAHPVAWWQLRSGRPVRRLDLGRTRRPVPVVPVSPGARRVVDVDEPSELVRLPDPAPVTVPRTGDEFGNRVPWPRAGRPAGQPAGQPLGQPLGQPVGQPVGQPLAAAVGDAVAVEESQREEEARGPGQPEPAARTVRGSEGDLGAVPGGLAAGLTGSLAVRRHRPVGAHRQGCIDRRPGRLGPEPRTGVAEEVRRVHLPGQGQDAGSGGRRPRPAADHV
jgi:hypothetical protein